MNDNQILIQEIFIKENKPIELWVYSPIIGVIYASTLLERTMETVNQEVSHLCLGRQIEIKQTMVA